MCRSRAAYPFNATLFRFNLPSRRPLRPGLASATFSPGGRSTAGWTFPRRGGRPLPPSRGSRSGFRARQPSPVAATDRSAGPGTRSSRSYRMPTTTLAGSTSAAAQQRSGGHVNCAWYPDREEGEQHHRPEVTGSAQSLQAPDAGPHDPRERARGRHPLEFAQHGQGVRAFRPRRYNASGGPSACSPHRLETSSSPPIPISSPRCATSSGSTCRLRIAPSSYAWTRNHKFRPSTAASRCCRCVPAAIKSRSAMVMAST